MLHSEVAEAAEALRRLLRAISDGTLDADGPLGANLVRGIHGALMALEGVVSADLLSMADRRELQ